MTTPNDAPITFYNGSGSPYGWRVWLTLEHKGLPYTHRILSFSGGETRTPEYRALSPRGKVPCLVHGDFRLWESNAIVEYLEDRFPTPSVWPAGGPEARAVARRLVSENDAYLYPVLRRVIAETLYKPAGEADATELENARAALRDELARLADTLTASEGPFAAGALSGADFALLPSLAFIDRIQARAPAYDVAADVPAPVRAYMDRLLALPIVQKTWPPHWRA